MKEAPRFGSGSGETWKNRRGQRGREVYSRSPQRYIDLDRIKEGSAPDRALGRELYAQVPALFHVAGRHVWQGQGKYRASDICWPLRSFAVSLFCRQKRKKGGQKDLHLGPAAALSCNRRNEAMGARGMDHHSLEMFIFSARLVLLSYVWLSE
jgi:hypothetical protein